MRAGAVAMVKLCGSSVSVTSRQLSGIATGAPGLARGE